MTVLSDPVANGDEGTTHVPPRRRDRVSLALGILMERFDVEEDEAFRHLVALAQRTQGRVEDAAESIIRRRATDPTFEVA